MYDKYIKRLLAIVLSFCGMVVLSPVFLVLILIVKLDSPGPVFFKQKRMGKNKAYFYIHKFRTMHVSAPQDCPTGDLQDPERYVTRSGKWMRKISADELPQIWDIFTGKMAVIGPRPALWNQYDLIEKRDKYGANNVRPGLTGWGQIYARYATDSVKARYDGEYVEKMSFLFDCRCFFGTIISMIKRNGVKEKQ